MFWPIEISVTQAKLYESSWSLRCCRIPSPPSLTICWLFSQGSATLRKLWSPTPQCLTLWSRRGPSSTCSPPSLLRFRGPAVGTPGTQVHEQTSDLICVAAVLQDLWICLVQHYFQFFDCFIGFHRVLCWIWQTQRVIQHDTACQCNNTCYWVLGVSITSCFTVILLVERPDQRPGQHTIKLLLQEKNLQRWDQKAELCPSAINLLRTCHTMRLTTNTCKNSEGFQRGSSPAAELIRNAWIIQWQRRNEKDIPLIHLDLKPELVQQLQNSYNYTQSEVKIR